MSEISLAVPGAVPMRALDGKLAINGNGFPTSVASLPATQSAEIGIAEMVRHHDAIMGRRREVVAEAEAVEDVVTADLLTGLISRHEKQVWILRATMRG